MMMMGPGGPGSTEDMVLLKCEHKEGCDLRAGVFASTSRSPPGFDFISSASKSNTKITISTHGVKRLESLMKWSPQGMDVCNVPKAGQVGGWDVMSLVNVSILTSTSSLPLFEHLKTNLRMTCIHTVHIVCAGGALVVVRSLKKDTVAELGTLSFGLQCF